MDHNATLGLALPIGVGLAALGSGFGLGKAVGSAMDAIGQSGFTRLNIATQRPAEQGQQPAVN